MASSHLPHFSVNNSETDEQNYLNQLLSWIQPKRQERNLVSAAFHMITITLISMSLVELEWFTIHGNLCTPYLTLGQFFWFDISDSDTTLPDYECITLTIVNMMRTIILLCFMAIVFSLGGFLLEILSPKGSMYVAIRKYSMASMCTIIWIMAIITCCYYVAILLEESLHKLYPMSYAVVTYGYGFYLIAATGGIALIGTFCTLILAHSSPMDHNSCDDTFLIDAYDDGLIDTFHGIPPPPPYNIPPPPYTP